MGPREWAMKRNEEVGPRDRDSAGGEREERKEEETRPIAISRVHATVVGPFNCSKTLKHQSETGPTNPRTNRQTDRHGDLQSRLLMTEKTRVAEMGEECIK